MAQQIRQGEVSVSPYADRKGSACDYCEYGDVCGFDRKIPDMCVRRLPELRKDEVWDKIEEALEDEYGIEMDE
jgi:ATP-dependent helicase/nuclease subunit B